MSARVLPTFGSQTELVANADAGVHGLSQNVSNTHGSSGDIDRDASNVGAPEVRPDASNTQAAASRIHHDAVYPHLVASKAGSDPPDGIHTTSSTHRDPVENQRGADGQTRAVCSTSTTSVAEHLLITS